MAKKSKDVSAGVQENRDLFAQGLGPKAGWCYDGDRDPEFFECDELDERVAKGEVSVSFDKTHVLDLSSGELERREAPARAITAPTLVNPVGAGATGADTTTTGVGGGARGGTRVTG